MSVNSVAYVDHDTQKAFYLLASASDFNVIVEIGQLAG